MLQPFQLQQVASSYPAEITELRNFLRASSVPVDISESLPTVTTKLQHDRTFRRDLTSHIWLIANAGTAAVSVPDLLGILAVAAAGVQLANTASDADAHTLLRFLMEARRSFDTPSAAPQVIPIRPIAQPVAPTVAPAPIPVAPVGDRAPILLSRREPSFYEDESTSNEGGIFSDRRSVVGLVIAACLLIALCLGLLLRHSTSQTPTIAGSTALETAPATTAPAPMEITMSPAEQAHPSSKAALPAHLHAGHATNRIDPENAPVASMSRKPSPLVSPAAAASTPSASPSARSLRPVSRTYAGNISQPRNTSPQPANPSSTNSLIARVQPVELGSNADGSPATGTFTSHAPTVRPTSLGIMAANVAYSPAPSYPPAASAARVQGEVKVEAEVGPDGNVESARVISGPPLLREAAVSAVEQWRYRPYVADGKPITMSALIVMDFQLPK